VEFVGRTTVRLGPDAPRPREERKDDEEMEEEIIDAADVVVEEDGVEL
jgi:hypothetical protein